MAKSTEESECRQLLRAVCSRLRVKNTAFGTVFVTGEIPKNIYERAKELASKY